MDQSTTRVPARSKRQAMDWSLVLVSQGIGTTIDYAEEPLGWGLLVAPEDYERAISAIRQYHLENRGWPWRREVFAPGFMFDAGSLVWVALVVVFFWLSEAQPRLRDAGMMDNQGVAHGQWWRLFTATLLHTDLAHLTTNAVFGALLLGLAMGRFGTGIGLLAAFFAGAGGNATALLISPENHRSLGASGMVMGALGLLAAQSFSDWRRGPLSIRGAIAGVAGGIMLFVLLGLTPGTDIAAHSGGFFCGLLLGMILSHLPRLTRSGRANLFAGLLFGAITILAWWKALK